ncbi:hypothetical protein D3C81_2330240 [compost metagenome]
MLPNAKKARTAKAGALGANGANRSVGLNLLRNKFVFEEKIIQRAERTVLFYLINGHFVTVYR